MEKTPDHTAVCFEETALSYRELNTRVNQLAHYLRKNGVAKESKVGLLVDRSLDMLIGILGIQKAGGAYLPMDPEYPRARLEYMLEDSESPVLVTQSAFLDSLSRLPDNTVALDRDADKIASESKENPEPLASAGNLSHLIYTSGSTGLPKGVMIEHRNVTAFLYWALNEFTYDEYEEMIASTSMCFDLSVFEFFLPLITGARVIILKSSLDLDDYLKTGSATMINTVPSALKHLVSVTKKRHRVKAINLAGEPLKLNLVKEAYDKLDVAVIRNLYGPTEDTTYSTGFRIPKEFTRQPLIGKPVDNTRVYILDESLKLVPIGVKGEIYLSGDQLARGYWKAPEKTSERFIPNPYSEGGAYPFVYKTGDLGSWQPDGNIVFHGRVDYQVKIRGNRIEMGEIEACLAGHPEVDDVVVIDRDDEEGNKFLVCYYVSGAEIPVSRLRGHITETLPDYMVPSRFMRLEVLPLTPNGKVDREKLPETDGIRPVMETEYVAPRDELEEILSGIWQEILGLDKVGIYDNFFELGGDSIISLQVVGRLKKKGYDIQPRDIFEHQTIFELIPFVEAYTVVQAEQGPVVGEAPLTPIQKWFFDLGVHNKNHFNQAVMIKSAVPIDEAALHQSVLALAGHHDVLRACFTDQGQVFNPPGQEIYFKAKAVEDESDLDREVVSLQSSFDIRKGPVFGVGLYRMGGEDYLLLAGHHLAVDGVSWRILFEDLLTAYGAAAGSNEIIFPEKTTSYKEWAGKLAPYSERSDVRAESAFWQDYLAGIEPHVPVDMEGGGMEGGGNDMGASDVVFAALDEKETRNLLRDAHRAYNTEVNDLLITALMRALQDWTGREQVVFDLEGHGREDVVEGVDVSRTVGWFTAIYPVVLGVDRASDLAHQIKYVKERLRSIPVKGFNYGMLRGVGAVNGLINTGLSFNYLGQLAQSASEGEGLFELAKANVPGTVDAGNKRANLIDVICVVTGTCLDINMVYSTRFHKRETIERLAGSFREELSRVVAHCLDPESFDITPSDFKLAELSQEDIDDLYDE